MAGFLSANILDYDGESANFRVGAMVLNFANWTMQATMRGDFMIALAAMIVGTIKGYKYGNRTEVSSVPATSPLAQRELKMVVSYHDAVTSAVMKPVEFPCPDLTHLDPGDRAHFQIGDLGHVDAFITAFEALVLSDALNAVEVDEITLVGRRL